MSDQEQHFCPDDLARHAPILIWSTDTDGRCVWFNERWLAYTGSTLESAVADGRYASLHEEDQEATQAAFDAAFELRDSLQLEYRLRGADGRYRWMLDRSTPRNNDVGEFLGYIGVCTDISHEFDFRQNIASRERMLAQLLGINDRERGFLSHAVHDGILQDIIGAEMLLHNIEQLEPEKQEKKLTLARATLRSALKHGRRLISELRPLILRDEGLVRAIASYAAELEARCGIRFDVKNGYADSPRNPLWSGNVFRAVQAAMNNIEVHSQVNEAAVEVSQTDDGYLQIVVADEGVGFEYEPKRESMGLRCIRERAELVGGMVSFETALGSGCRVTIRVPLPVAETS